MRLIKAVFKEELVFEAVVRVLDFVLAMFWRLLVKEDGSVAEGPEAHDEHGNGCVLQILEGVLLEFFVVHWWLSVVIEQSVFLNDVHTQNSESGNRK